MSICNPITTFAEVRIKLKQDSPESFIDRILYKSVVESLRYLTITRPDIMFAVGLMSRYMEEPTQEHFKAATRILKYVQGSINEGLFYSQNAYPRLVGYTDIDYGGKFR